MSKHTPCARRAIFTWINRYNQHRLHSSLGYMRDCRGFGCAASPFLATATTSRRNSSGNAFGMINILPVRTKSSHVRYQPNRQHSRSAYDDSGDIFTREDGSVIDPRLLTRTFGRHVTASGVPKIRLHDARHSYATAALRAGISAKVVSERLGHASIAITLDTYSHVLPQADEEAAATVERLIVGN